MSSTVTTADATIILTGNVLEDEEIAAAHLTSDQMQAAYVEAVAYAQGRDVSHRGYPLARALRLELQAAGYEVSEGDAQDEDDHYDF